VVEHDARLEILCCLHPTEPMGIAQVSSKTGMQPRCATHHLRILDSFGLVSGTEDVEGGQALYVTRLKQSPAWVTRAVNRHRQAAAE
jgi:predicted transcriptional regulator